jgi:hypothetical protein
VTADAEVVVGAPGLSGREVGVFVKLVVSDLLSDPRPTLAPFIQPNIPRDPRRLCWSLPLEVEGRAVAEEFIELLKRLASVKERDMLSSAYVGPIDVLKSRPCPDNGRGTFDDGV